MNILIFDLDDTLIADVAAAHTATAATLAASDAPADDETVAAALRISRKMWKAHPHRRTGALADVSAWEALWLPPTDPTLPAAVSASLREHEREVWSATLASLGVTPAAAVAAAAAETYRALRQMLLQPIPGIESALTSLGRTHRLWLATNGVPTHQRQKLQAVHLDVAFDVVFVSGDVGAPKADPHFAATLRRALHDAQVCQVVGDSVTQDLQLAANGGWAATHICQPESCTAASSPASATVVHMSSLAGVRCAC